MTVDGASPTAVDSAIMAAADQILAGLKGGNLFPSAPAAQTALPVAHIATSLKAATHTAVPKNELTATCTSLTGVHQEGEHTSGTSKESDSKYEKELSSEVTVEEPNQSTDSAGSLTPSDLSQQGAHVGREAPPMPQVNFPSGTGAEPGDGVGSTLGKRSFPYHEESGALANKPRPDRAAVTPPPQLPRQAGGHPATESRQDASSSSNCPQPQQGQLQAPQQGSQDQGHGFPVQGQPSQEAGQTTFQPIHPCHQAVPQSDLAAAAQPAAPPQAHDQGHVQAPVQAPVRAHVEAPQLRPQVQYTSGCNPSAEQHSYAATSQGLTHTTYTPSEAPQVHHYPAPSVVYEPPTPTTAGAKDSAPLPPTSVLHATERGPHPAPPVGRHLPPLAPRPAACQAQTPSQAQTLTAHPTTQLSPTDAQFATGDTRASNSFNAGQPHGPSYQGLATAVHGRAAGQSQPSSGHLQPTAFHGQPGQSHHPGSSAYRPPRTPTIHGPAPDATYHAPPLVGPSESHGQVAAHNHPAPVQTQHTTQPSPRLVPIAPAPPHTTPHAPPQQAHAQDSYCQHQMSVPIQSQPTPQAGHGQPTAVVHPALPGPSAPATQAPSHDHRAQFGGRGQASVALPPTLHQPIAPAPPPPPPRAPEMTNQQAQQLHYGMFGQRQPAGAPRNPPAATHGHSQISLPVAPAPQDTAASNPQHAPHQATPYEVQPGPAVHPHNSRDTVYQRNMPPIYPRPPPTIHHHGHHQQPPQQQVQPKQPSQPYFGMPSLPQQSRIETASIQLDHMNHAPQNHAPQNQVTTTPPSSYTATTAMAPSHYGTHHSHYQHQASVVYHGTPPPSHTGAGTHIHALRQPSLPAPAETLPVQEHDSSAASKTPEGTTTKASTDVDSTLRNQRMQPTDCLLFAASLLQEGPATSEATSTPVQNAAGGVASHAVPRVNPPAPVNAQQHSMAQHGEAGNPPTVGTTTMGAHVAQPGYDQARLQAHTQQALPQDLDVLCGRGGLINKHTGNIIYRRVVEYNKPFYQSVQKRHRILVSQSIVHTILNRGGRFLCEDSETVTSADGFRSTVTVWKPVPTARAIQKTSQALRERPTGDSAKSKQEVASSDSGKTERPG